MPNLIKNKTFPLVLILFSGCTTSSFKVANQTRMRAELLVTPDRILLQCEDLQDPAEKLANDEGRYGFMIHVLDDENTILTLSQGNILGKKQCFEHVDKIGKILRNGQQIYIGGMGDLTDPRKKEEDHHTFPGKGVFYSNSRALQFIVIKNEKDECYSAHHGSDRPCPADPFPIENNPIENYHLR